MTNKNSRLLKIISITIAGIALFAMGLTFGVVIGRPNDTQVSISSSSSVVSSSFTSSKSSFSSSSTSSKTTTTFKGEIGAYGSFTNVQFEYMNGWKVTVSKDKDEVKVSKDNYHLELRFAGEAGGCYFGKEKDASYGLYLPDYVEFKGVQYDFRRNRVRFERSNYPAQGSIGVFNFCTREHGDDFWSPATGRPLVGFLYVTPLQPNASRIKEMDQMIATLQLK